MNIGEIYKAVEFQSNKIAKGWLKQENFNLCAKIAVNQAYTKYLGNPKDYQPGRPVATISYANTTYIHEALRPFKDRKVLLIDEYGQSPYPADYKYVTSMRHRIFVNAECGTDEDPVSGTVKVKILKDNEVGDLNSAIRKPTQEYPACEFMADYIQFYPADLRTAQIMYLKKPTAPFYAVTFVNNREVYDPANSVQLQFEESYHNEIVTTIVSLVAIHIRDGNLAQFAQMKEAQGV